MAHILVTIGYRTFVFPVEQGVQVAAAIADAHIYERKGYGPTRTVHCYPPDSDREITLEVISDEQLALAKLAGKPAKTEA